MLTLEPAKGSPPCESKCCLTCQHIRSGTSIQFKYCHQTNFPCVRHSDYKITNVVYLIECSLCRMQYVGETQNALRVWMNGHCGDITHRRID